MIPQPPIAVLVDCENAQPAALDHAMRIASTLGRVTIRRGYGNPATLIRWQETLVRCGCAPAMQFPGAGGKNTADIALALDALEMLLDRRAERFVIVTSDADFVGLCHRLQERGGMVQIVGEAKTPAALRQACDRFHEYVPAVTPAPQAKPPCAAPPASQTVASIKRRPRFVVQAVRELGAASPDGSVDLGALGNHLRKDRPDFTCAAYGFRNLRSMLESYDLLHIPPTGAGTCRVSLAPDNPAPPLQLVG